MITKGTSLSAVPPSRTARNGVGADEARVLLAAPAEPGLDRAALLHQVVAVEVKADLQAQRVVRTKADRLAPPSDQGVPDAAPRSGATSSSTPSSPV